MSSGSARPKRQYDARRRRERAAEERRATRTKVLEAATRLFVAKGYTATTMADIAREAGVAMQSVYTAGRSKADLLSAAVERAVAGDD
ncbi:MAG TPA: helix-turn-helix domain-containing protein, partial [Acidimicrobiales bacterium]|nr:helix-turn-helix domain-containing protein [Acidimicrobiales bacterium]